MASLFMPGLVDEDMVSDVPVNDSAVHSKVKRNSDKEVIEHGSVLTESIFQRRKSAAANMRRQAAADWLQQVVGPLDMPLEPAEVDLRNCLRNGVVLCHAMNFVEPGAVEKVLENATGPLTPCGQQSLIQNIENIRGYLEAAQRLRIPAFEPNSLDQETGGLGAMPAVVESILGLKRHHESKLLEIPQDGMSTPTQPSSPRRREVPPATPTSLRSDLMSGWDRAHMGYRAKGLDSPSTPRTGVLGQSLDFLPSRLHLGDTQTVDQCDSPGEADSTADIIFSVSRALRQQVNSKRVVTDTGKNSQQPSPNKVTLRSHFSKLIRPGSSHDDILPVLEMVVQTLMREFESRVVAQKRQIDRLSEENDGLLQELLSQAQQKDRGNIAGSTEAKVELENLDEQSLKLQAELEALAMEQQQAMELARVSEQAERDAMEQVASMESSAKDINARLAISEAQEAQLNFLRAQLARYEGVHQERLPWHMSELKDLKASLCKTKSDMGTLQHEWIASVKTMEQHVTSLSKAAGGYYTVVAENRRLYNELQELRGNIRVYCRVRPLLGESAGKNTIVDRCENGDIMVSNPLKANTRKTFTFDKVFDSETTQEQVFTDAQPLIRSVLDGFNVCLFAYGQTGSGKTHTMTGPRNMSEEQWGVNNRALRDLFAFAKERSETTKYEVAVQMVEIYNEQVRDLLCSDSSKQRLEIRGTSQPNGMQVPDATLESVESMENVLRVMDMGQRNRAVGATALNDRSSRSHSVLTVHVTGRGLGGAPNTRACLHLVDLAGSERVDRSEAVGERLREAQHINKSLSALGDVIAALAQKNAHVPYRNSKLTQILQDSLGGHAKTLMFVHVSPEIESFGESLSTLKFAERVSSVELGTAKSNNETSELRELREMVANLKEKLVEKERDLDHYRQGGSPSVVTSVGGLRLFSAPSSARRLSVGQSAGGKKPVDNTPINSEEVRSRIFSRQSVDGSLQGRKRNPILMRSMVDSPLSSSTEPGAPAVARYSSLRGQPSPSKVVPDNRSHSKCQAPIRTPNGTGMQAGNQEVSTAKVLPDGSLDGFVHGELLGLRTPFTSGAGWQAGGGYANNEMPVSSVERLMFAQASSSSTSSGHSLAFESLVTETSLRERDSNVQVSAVVIHSAQSTHDIFPSTTDIIGKSLGDENLPRKPGECVDKYVSTGLKDEQCVLPSSSKERKSQEADFDSNPQLFEGGKSGEYGSELPSYRYARDDAAAPTTADDKSSSDSEVGAGVLVDRILMGPMMTDTGRGSVRALRAGNPKLAGDISTRSSLDCGTFSVGASSGGPLKRQTLKQERVDAILSRSRTAGPTNVMRKGGHTGVAAATDSAVRVAAPKRIALTFVEADGTHRRTPLAVVKTSTSEPGRSALLTPSTAGASMTLQRRLSLFSATTTPGSLLSTPESLSVGTPVNPPSTIQSKPQRISMSPTRVPSPRRGMLGGASRVPITGASSVRKLIDGSTAKASAVAKSGPRRIFQGKRLEGPLKLVIPNLSEAKDPNDASPAESSGSGWSSGSHGAATHDTASGQSSGARSGSESGSLNEPQSSFSPEISSAPKKRLLSGDVPKYLSSSTASSAKEKLGSWKKQSGLGPSLVKESEGKGSALPLRTSARRVEANSQSWTSGGIQRGNSSDSSKPDGRRLWK